MRYTIITGYHERSGWDSDFFGLWAKFIRRETDNKINVFYTYRMPPIPEPWVPGGIQAIKVFNAGHVGDLINGTKDGPLCGWSHSVLLGAMYCLAANTDMIFVEQDVIAFGKWVDQLYKDCEGKGMVFGGKMKSAPYMCCAQGLFLIKREYLQEFIQSYLALPPDKEMLPESKFCHIRDNTTWCGELSFGVDRERPIPWDAPVWYAQHLNEEEVAKIERIYAEGVK